MHAHTPSIDIRDAFFDEIYKMGKEKDVVFLTDDMDAFGLRKFKQDYTERFINIGVAEQNMINVAAGLALCGKKVFAYGIASFVTLRCFEQIKVNVCSLNLPVTLIGVGTGFSFGFDGPTHHGTQDVALMRTLPEMTIYNPSDITTAKLSARWAYQNAGPTYIRLDKGAFPIFYKETDNFSTGFRVLKELKEINILSTGFMVSQALELARELEKRSVSVGVVDLFRLKPIAQEALIREVLHRSNKIVTLEDNSIVNGLGTAVAEILVESGCLIPMKRIAAQDKQFIQYGQREWFHKINGLQVGQLLEDSFFYKN